MAVYLTLFGALIVASVLLLGFMGIVATYVRQIVDDPKDYVSWVILAGLVGAACLVAGKSMLEGSA